MMGLDPISVELSDFNRLEVLREEEARLCEELVEIEKQMRGRMLARAEAEFLMQLSPYYATKQEEVASNDVSELEARRQLINSAIEAVKAQREAFEQALAGQTPGGGAAPKSAKTVSGSKSSSFQSFEDFRENRG
jgi:hypothetical protein